MIADLLLTIKPVRYFAMGRKFFKNTLNIQVEKINHIEKAKRPSRTEIINYLLDQMSGDKCYLEIGVRDPADNFNHINAKKKYCVDPGVVFQDKPVDFPVTSDEFFDKLSKNEFLSNDIRFDVIFIDGLHISDQVDRDIENALKYIKENGFIVLHDCNPVTEWHAREERECYFTPAQRSGNGTTWKAYFKWRCNSSVNSCCIDSDWGVGILSKKYQIGKSIVPTNPFYEFAVLDTNRKEHLNLIDFETFKQILGEIKKS